jgi:hypothetical protein
MSQSTKRTEELAREFHEKVALGPAPSADVMNSPFVKMLDKLKAIRPDLYDCKPRELTGYPFKDGFL